MLYQIVSLLVQPRRYVLHRMGMMLDVHFDKSDRTIFLWHIHLLALPNRNDPPITAASLMYVQNFGRASRFSNMDDHC